ncbi:probable G-protein coupled receptor 82 isoform X2 [Alosa sapidissima]|uniref:probable G-protein coupled receptor 82 isoform X2 n=1 Tax=Alosa sapidissima TaxID=34773 RepID=UPI001C098F1B|nr:probable G-protein coupled receptor 82 isoform X2 [Alosa sapidissima]
MSQTDGLENASRTMNQRRNCTVEPEITHSVVFPWIYLFLALLGLLTNSLVFLDLRRTKRKPTVIFALNMVLSDVIQCFSLFFRMTFYLNANEWEAEQPMCGVTIFVSVTVFYINVYCNMCFLLWISLCRFTTVVRPDHTILRVFREVRLCRRICQVTWLVVVVLIGSHMVYKEYKGKGMGGNCFDHMNNRRKTSSSGMHAIGLVVFYPNLLVMLFSYTLLLYHLQRIHKSSQLSQTQGSGGGLRVKRKVIASVLVFLVCFLPYHIQRSILLLSRDPGNCGRTQKKFRVKTNTILLAAFNCCLNPILHLVFRLACCRGKRLRPAGAEGQDIHIVGSLDSPT